MEVEKGGPLSLNLSLKPRIPSQPEQHHTLRALAVVSEDPLYKKTILEKGGMIILEEYSKTDNSIIIRQVARVLANLSSDDSQEAVYLNIYISNMQLMN